MKEFNFNFFGVGAATYGQGIPVLPDRSLIVYNRDIVGCTTSYANFVTTLCDLLRQQENPRFSASYIYDVDKNEDDRKILYNSVCTSIYTDITHAHVVRKSTATIIRRRFSNLSLPLAYHIFLHDVYTNKWGDKT